MLLIINMTNMQTCIDFEIKLTNLCSSTLERIAQNCKYVVIKKNPQGSREPSSAKTIASGKNVVQATISGDRCHRNPKILINYLICTVTAVTAQSFDHLLFDRWIPRTSIERFNVSFSFMKLDFSN